jgi:mannose-6-phosphate isomerase
MRDLAIRNDKLGIRKVKGIYKLQNEIKHYEWGSPTFIPALLRIENTRAEPYAEVWMGAHPSGRSYTLVDGEKLPLDTLIDRDRQYFLGAACAKKFNALPFLLKLLAAEKPLSIQAHPNLEQAGRGFEKENLLGIALSAPERNYKDANHKPEIICALSDFRAMCGFRDAAEIIVLLKKLNAPSALPLISALADGKGNGSYQLFLEKLFSLPQTEPEKLSTYITDNIEDIKKIHSELCREWEMIGRFNKLFPNDPSVLAPLYLNVIDLKPGEAIFLPAGIAHAYVSGFGVELMTASDNVLRGGLTNKYIDHKELLSVLKMESFLPQITHPPRSGYFEYPSGADEFRLIFMEGSGTAKKKLPVNGPAIIVVVEGSLVISFSDETLPMKLTAGESIFIASGLSRDEFILEGNYRLYAASPPPA